MTRTGTEDRFEIRETLGQGALGAVYRAQDAATGQEVALKVLHAHASGEEDRLRFKQEFRAMTRLRHPNLCAVHDFGITAAGAPFFTMEVVAGQDLAAELPLAPARLLALLPPLARALGYLHRQGLVHGDVKPENVRVADDGDLKLMDLGFLTPAGQPAPTPRGTLAYMAPELIRGDRVDARADIYALGAMCYHLLAGRPPFAGDSPIDVLRAHLTRRPRPLREIDPAIPPDLEAVVAKMMAREPVARHASLGEVLADLGLDEGADTGRQPLASAFVGRQAELTAFQDALRALKREAQGRALAYVGATGAGKTRLLDELRVLAQLEEVPFLAGPATEAGTPYGPFVRLLRAVLPATREAIATAPPEQRAALALILPELAGGEAPAPLDPQAERILIQAAIAHALRGVAPHGAVIALDDWDRADAASTETLAYLRRNAQGVPFVTVALGREAGYLGKDAKPLPPLTTAEVAALAGSMLGAPAPEAFTTAVWRWTGGHAGHVQRVVAHLVRAGALGREQGRWTYPADLAQADLGADFRAMVVAPLSALTGPAGQIAELTAVVGDGASLDTLADLSGLDEETLFQALDELRARQILEVREGRVSFASGGLEDAVYGRINEGNRLWLHAAAAMKLEAALADAPAADVGQRTALARHYMRSRQAPKALPAALAAADLNLAVFAVDAARTLLLGGLALAAEQPADHAAWRRDYLTRLAAVERWRGDFEAMGACLDEALPLAEALAEADPGALARLLVMQGAYHNQRMTPAALKASVEVLTRAVGLAHGVDPTAEARGRYFLGQAHFYLGQPEEARQAFDQAATQAEADDLPYWRAESMAFLGYLEATGAKARRDAGIQRMADAAALQTALGNTYGHGFTAALQGDALLQFLRLPEAEQAFKAQHAIAQELGVGEDSTTGLANLAIVQALAGRPRAALAICDEVIPQATQFGHPVGLLARAVAGYAHAGLGELKRAEEALHATEAAARGEGGYMFAHAVPFLLEGWLRLGRAEEARRLADQALWHFRDHPNDDLQAQVRGLLAEARLRLGEADAAAALADEALAAARAHDHPLATWYARRAMARLALHRGEPDAAREAAEAALALAEQAGAHGLAAEAAVLAGEAALAAGLPEAATRYRAVQVYADREGAPVLRAIALHGQAAADPASERGEAMALEAQQILRSLADGLDPLARQAFLGQPALRRVLAERPEPVRQPLTVEGGQEVFARIKTVSEDLLGFANQYGALFKEWIASNRQLEMLNALARRINETLDLDDVLGQVAALTLELTQAERAFVLLAEGEALTVRTAVDRLGRPLADARVSQTVCRGVLDGGEPVAVLDATLTEGLAAQASIADLNLRTLMCVPLAARGQRLGVLYVDSRAVVTTFTRKDLELLMAIASHASLAIANATLYAESRRRGDELEKALAMYREAAKQANTDALTGLANRRCFEEMAARELDATRRYQRPLALLALDVDRFKAINDTHGHATGDEVLKAVAGVVAGEARICDVAARLGGEEFVVLCPETGLDGATALAERIRLATRALGAPLPPVTISVGIAALQPDEDLPALLARADQALYAAKAGGRDMWVVADAPPPSRPKKPRPMKR